MTGAGLGSEEEEGSAETSTEQHSHGSRWPKSTAILGEELSHQLGEQGSDRDGSENVPWLPGAVKEKKFMC